MVNNNFISEVYQNDRDTNLRINQGLLSIQPSLQPAVYEPFASDSQVLTDFSHNTTLMDISNNQTIIANKLNAYNHLQKVHDHQDPILPGYKPTIMDAVNTDVNNMIIDTNAFFVTGVLVFSFLVSSFAIINNV